MGLLINSVHIWEKVVKSGKILFYGWGVSAAMFRGSDPINMDAKGRMSIPTRYRELLSEMCAGDLVITIDM